MLITQISSELNPFHQIIKNPRSDFNPNKLPAPKISMPKTDWYIWMIMCGRGWGKTYAAAYYLAKMLCEGRINRLAIVAPTFPDAIVKMWYQIQVFLPREYKLYRHLKIITYKQEVVANLISGAAINSIRGHSFDFVWIDEFCYLRHPKETFENLKLALRQGVSRMIISTTPSNNEFINNISRDTSTYLTQGASYENSNLSRNFFSTIEKMDVNDQWYKQEIEGQIVYDDQLWESHHIKYDIMKNPHKAQYVIGVDPAMSTGRTGIVVAAYEGDRAYIVDDFSMGGTIKCWGRTLAEISKKYEDVHIVVEINQGGESIRDVLQMMGVTCPIHCTRAHQNKYTRNISSYMMYENDQVFHTKKLHDLECEMLYQSADRVDALTWALFLMATGQNKFFIEIIGAK